MGEGMARDDARQHTQAVEAYPLLLVVHPWLRVHSRLLQACHPRIAAVHNGCATHLSVSDWRCRHHPLLGDFMREIPPVGGSAREMSRALAEYPVRLLSSRPCRMAGPPRLSYARTGTYVRMHGSPRAVAHGAAIGGYRSDSRETLAAM